MAIFIEENRSYPRFSCHFKVQVQVSDYCSLEMLAIEVSLLGLRLQTLSAEIQLAVNTEIALTIERQFNLPYLHFSGSIKHEIDLTEKKIYGIHIISLDSETESHWNTLVSFWRQHALKTSSVSF